MNALAQEPMKDVISCDKLRVGAHSPDPRFPNVGTHMGNPHVSYSEYIAHTRVNLGN